MIFLASYQTKSVLAVPKSFICNVPELGSYVFNTDPLLIEWYCHGSEQIRSCNIAYCDTVKADQFVERHCIREIADTCSNILCDPSLCKKAYGGYVAERSCLDTIRKNCKGFEQLPDPAIIK